MSDKFKAVTLASGETLQSSVPKVPRSTPPALEAHGILVRGVVLRTFVFDDDNVPARPNPVVTQSAVYCDVLGYMGLPGNRTHVFKNCLVAQERSGLHDGDLWYPSPTTMDISNPAAGPNPNAGTDPANMDGDHVLLGFMDNDLTLPVVLRSIPHPKADQNGSPVDKPGQRVKLYTRDKQVRMWRHHGTFFGVDANGDLLFDTTRAHDGTLIANGAEPTPTLTGANGNFRVRVPKASKVTIEIVDNPDAPELAVGQLAQVIIENGKISARINNGASFEFTDMDGNAKFKLGDGAVHVPIVEVLEALWGQLKAQLDAFDTGHAGQFCGVGPVSAPPPISAPAWNSAINSTKVSIPNG